MTKDDLLTEVGLASLVISGGGDVLIRFVTIREQTVTNKIGDLGLTQEGDFWIRRRLPSGQLATAWTLKPERVVEIIHLGVK
jgi:hypothetical protein